MTRITCGQALEQMQRALGHDDAGTPPALAAHLGECAACAEAWAAQHAVRELLAGRDPAPVPPGFTARLDAALDDLMPWWLRIDWRWWTLRAAAPLAALLLLAGGAATWTAASSSDTGGSSVTSALVDTSSSVSNDSLLLAVLSGSPDDAVSRYEGGIE
jgi:hypothetical protein